MNIKEARSAVESLPPTTLDLPTHISDHVVIAFLGGKVFDLTARVGGLNENNPEDELLFTPVVLGGKAYYTPPDSDYENGFLFFVTGVRNGREVKMYKLVHCHPIHTL